MKKILLATHNKGKIKELFSMLSDLPVEIVTLSDVGITEDIKEDGKTYKRNSQKKALFYAKKSGLPAIADDGGLEINALNGAPGINSRRWLGHEGTDDELIAHLEKVSAKLTENNRKAFFRTVVSFAMPSGKVWSTFGEVEGVITKEPLLKISEGYPYRSFFFIPELNKFYHESELSNDEQKRYNHRYKAIQKLIPIIHRVILN